jgi:hypothetical protein
MTPEAYIAAVKASPRIAWVKWYSRGNSEELCRGHAIRREGNCTVVIPDDKLSSKVWMRWYAKETSDPSHLFALKSSCTGSSDYIDETSCFFGEIPPKDQLRDYFVSKHGNLRGLNLLFPRRIQKRAAVEWVKEQLEKQRIRKRSSLKSSVSKWPTRGREICGSVTTACSTSATLRNVRCRV